jgi:hypothetical protein
VHRRIDAYSPIFAFPKLVPSSSCPTRSLQHFDRSSQTNPAPMQPVPTETSDAVTRDMPGKLVSSQEAQFLAGPPFFLWTFQLHLTLIFRVITSARLPYRLYTIRRISPARFRDPNLHVPIASHRPRQYLGLWTNQRISERYGLSCIRCLQQRILQ